jgi:hypothetical protein
MIDDDTLKATIDRIAPTLSQGPMGLAQHRSEYWAKANRSFENVAEKVLYDGGASVSGWVFSYRSGDGIPAPGYLLVSHHAVWHAPDGRLVDVTPYPKAALRPISPGEDTLFLVDAAAAPGREGKRFVPLPPRFFALSEDPGLAAYVAGLERALRGPASPGASG